MIRFGIRMRMILNIVEATLLCVILAMVIAFFIVRYQNNQVLNQRIIEDKQAIQKRIDENLERVRIRIDEDRALVEQKLDQDARFIDLRLQEEKQTAARWIEQAGGILEYLLRMNADMLSATAAQIGTDPLHGANLKKNNRDKTIDFLQAVLGGNKEASLKELFRTARINAIHKVVLYDLEGEWYCAVLKKGDQFHLTYSADRSGAAFRQALAEKTTAGEYLDTSAAPDLIEKLPGSIPDQGACSLKSFGGLLWVEAWAPVQNAYYNNQTQQNEMEQVGLISVACPLDQAFLEKASNLTGMKVNSFVGADFSAGLVRAYDKLDSGIVAQVVGLTSSRLFDSSMGVINEIKVADEGYVDGLYPVFEAGRWLGGLSLLFPTREMQDRIAQMQLESQKNVALIQTASEKTIQEIRNQSAANIAEMEQESGQRIEFLKQEAGRNRRSLILYMTLTTLAALLIIIPVTWFLATRITRPIKNIVYRFKDIAQGAGDLTARLETDRSDEIGELSRWFNTFMEKVQHIIRAISENAGTLNTSAVNLSQLSGHMSQGAEHMSAKSNTVAIASEEMSTNMKSVSAAMEQTASSVNIVAASIEEMTSTINEIARNTDQGRTISSQAVLKVKSASDRVAELGQDALEINKVTETINEISDQTNLLALNATIEAARAGESGKGFAVVANEIKELARQTASATMEIKARIDGIQHSTAGTVTDIGQISTVIHEVNELVTAIAASVEEQSLSAREIADNINQISTGIQEVNQNVAQSNAVAGDIAKDIGEANQGAGEISTSSSQVNLSADELKHLAEKLQQMVGQFRI